MTHPTDPVVAVSATHLEAETTLKKLSSAGFDLKKLSIVGKGFQTEEHAVGFYTVGDRIKTWGGLGSFWGAIWGLLAGPAVFIVPPVGLVAAAGPFAISLIAALEAAVVVGGISALGAALYGLGMTESQAIKYESDLKANRFLVIVHGVKEDIAQARAILALAPGVATLAAHV